MKQEFSRENTSLLNLDTGVFNLFLWNHENLERKQLRDHHPIFSFYRYGAGDQSKPKIAPSLGHKPKRALPLYKKRKMLTQSQ